jgi:hypothetical protein
MFTTNRIISSTLIALATLVPAAAFAAPFDNASLGFGPHPRPVILAEQDVFADAISLEDGNALHVVRQTVGGVRLWRFEIGAAYWWVSPLGVIYGKETHPEGSPESLLEAANDEEAYGKYISML